MAIYYNEIKKCYGFTFWYDGKRYRGEKKSWSTQKMAKEEERKRKNELDLGIKNGSISFEQVKNYYLEFEKGRLAPSTYRSKETIIDYHLKEFYSVPIDKITLRMINSWQIRLKESKYIPGLKRDSKKHKKSKKKENETKKTPRYYSNDMLERIQIILRQIFEYALNHDYLKKNILKLTPIIKRNDVLEEREIQIYTYDQFKQFISVVDDFVYYALFNVGYWCGMRPGEIKALNIGDYDPDRKVLYVRKNYDSRNKYMKNTKTGNDRIVAVPNVLKEILDNLILSYKDYETNSTTPLFKPTGRISDSTLTNRKNRYIKESGVPYITNNQLRHTHISTMRKLGLSTFEISKRTGHSPAMIEKVYSHLDNEQQQNIVNALDTLASSHD